MNTLDKAAIEAAFTRLGELMADEDLAPVALVVCGGAALIARGLVARTTQDADVVALAAASGDRLLDPEPLPADFLAVAERVRLDLGLPPNWLNNGPSRGEGGLYRAGLPAGLMGRTERRDYGPRLTVHFLGRLDLICLKLPAAVDHSGGRHLDDLLALAPTPAELRTAATWARTYDPSDGFLWLMRRFFKDLGYDDLAEQL